MQYHFLSLDIGVQHRSASCNGVIQRNPLRGQRSGGQQRKKLVQTIRRWKSPVQPARFVVSAGSTSVKDAPTPSGTDDGSKVLYKREYQVKDSVLNAETRERADGRLQATIETNITGKLLLHWGLQGDEGEGWKLPEQQMRPAGTVEYKHRALQTPLKKDDDGFKRVSIEFGEKESAKYLNFVLKDDRSGTWYDLNGGNFHIPLRLESIALANNDETECMKDEKRHENREAKKTRNLLSEKEIPPIPQELAGVWSYMKWEAAGCPNRSQEEADREYKNAFKEIVMFLRRRVSLGELQSIAHDGYQRYQAFVKQQDETWGKPKVADDPLQDTSSMFIDQEMINLKAYLMWEEAGKPDGADFGEQAKELIENQVKEGMTVQDIRRSLQSGTLERSVDVAQESMAASDTVVHEAPEERVEDEIAVGASIGMKYRNPLDLIHRSQAPRLSEVRKRNRKPLEPLWKAARENEDCVWHRVYSLGSKSELLVSVVKEADDFKVVLTTDNASDVVMHWGVKSGGKSWKRPDPALLTTESKLIKDGIAAETPFSGCTADECHVEIGGSIVPLQRVELSVPKDSNISALSFVLRSGDGSRWWKDGGSDFTAPLVVKRQGSTASPDSTMEDALSQIIVDCEVNSGAWTLMHRFNKAADLLDEIIQGQYEPAEKAMATIFVWLRYSAIRQLTWQRNYNTQPRILGAAQERLTHKISDAYSALKGEAKEWARLCLTTVGRGGNAQAVRDEILNIMHRNHIKEVKGTWMEEFHQKLHNNTTPDDIGICEAYLAFLKSDGDLGAYWGCLSDHGIDRQRLESFDRAIVTEPEFFEEKKADLTKDFTNYLGILKATHSGADLHASISAASPFVPSSVKSYLGFVMARADSNEILPLMEAAVEARTEINSLLGDQREIMYLDLALENLVRAAAERGAGASGAALIEPLLQNLALSLENNEEICYCLKAWQELPVEVKTGQHPSKDQALRGMSVLERIQRALADTSDHTVASLNDLSMGLGQAFGCDEWAVQLFAEEVVRGGPAFALGLVLSNIEPTLRAAADLGAWQVISPVSSVSGRIQLVPDLHSVSDHVYKEPTILLAARVTGEEEVPLGVVGILSRDAPDVLSHLSVRCRNMGALFVACHEAEPLEELEAMNGKVLTLLTSAAGAVSWEEGAATNGNEGSSANHSSSRPPLRVSKPTWCKSWSIGMDMFSDGVVGAKSKNLANLRGKLPEWIRLPPSVAIPFGTFEAVLKDRDNQEIAKELQAVVKKVIDEKEINLLPKCRELVHSLHIPENAKLELAKTMEASGVPVPRSPKAWSRAAEALKAVWASKYNERAYTSTTRVGISFEDVSMAVLVQKVVSARYAFVIHTTNPMTGNEDEIYCELVRGMGEAIVSGTVPGSALAFTALKSDLDNPKVVLYPSKSQGMFVREDSLIFRSDSNGEDLEGYAGAGLYDSVTTAVMTQEVVDYSSDPVVSDPDFARDLMSRVCQVGAAIEASLQSPQDVEGVIDPELNITVVQTRPQM